MRDQCVLLIEREILGSGGDGLPVDSKSAAKRSRHRSVAMREGRYCVIKCHKLLKEEAWNMELLDSYLHCNI